MQKTIPHIFDELCYKLAPGGKALVQAFLPMKRMDIATLERAFAGL